MYVKDLLSYHRYRGSGSLGGQEVGTLIETYKQQKMQDGIGDAA